MHGRGIGSRGRHYDAVVHGAVVFQCFHHLRHGGTLLADRDINANHVAALLVDDGVDRNGGLAGLAVADDQLALAAADRNHGVDGFDAGLHRLFHRCRSTTPGAMRSIGLNSVVSIGPLPSMGWPSAFTTRPTMASPTGTDMMLPGAPDFVAFLDLLVFAQQYRSHLVFFQIDRDAGDAVRELDQFAGHDAIQAVNAGDSVTHRDHRAGLGNIDRFFVMLNFAAQYARDFISLDLSHIKSPPLVPRAYSPALFSGIFRQLAPQLLQLPAQRSVVKRRPDAGRSASQQLRINREAQAHPLSGQPR